MAILPCTDHDVSLPAGLNDCTLCKSRLELYVEAVWDWDGAGELVRVGCLCPESIDDNLNYNRTEFQYERQTVEEWNDMNPASKP